MAGRRGNYRRSRYMVRARQRRPAQDATFGAGAVRELTWVFGWFRERVTEYLPSHEFSYVVERSVPPRGGRLTFTEVPEGTLVRWTTTVQLRMPFAAAVRTRLLGRPVIIRTVGNVIDTAAAALTGGPR